MLNAFLKPFKIKFLNLTYRFKPMPIASVATIILQEFEGSLNFSAIFIFVSRGRSAKYFQ